MLRRARRACCIRAVGRDERYLAVRVAWRHDKKGCARSGVGRDRTRRGAGKTWAARVGPTRTCVQRPAASQDRELSWSIVCMSDVLRSRRFRERDVILSRFLHVLYHIHHRIRDPLHQVPASRAPDVYMCAHRAAHTPHAHTRSSRSRVGDYTISDDRSPILCDVPPRPRRQGPSGQRPGVVHRTKRPPPHCSQDACVTACAILAFSAGRRSPF